MALHWSAQTSLLATVAVVIITTGYLYMATLSKFPAEGHNLQMETTSDASVAWAHQQAHRNLAAPAPRLVRGGTAGPYLDDWEMLKTSTGGGGGGARVPKGPPAATAVAFTIFSLLPDVRETFNGDARDAGHGSSTGSAWDANGRGWAFSHIQTVAALRTWLALPTADIILFGHPPTCRAFLDHAIAMPPPANSARGQGRKVAKVTCHNIPCTKALSSNVAVPTVDCLFKRAAELARTDIVVYANSDIMFFEDLPQCLTTVAAHADNFFLVGKRRDLFGFPRSGDEGSLGRMVADHSAWIADIRRRADAEARGHPREGIDYMAFRRSMAPKLPPFLAGRIQWDNAVTDPTIVTFEASDVVTAIHLNHGASKASHAKEGSQHNQQLAVYLPHPYVKEIKIYHPGTIWLGRLDETEYNLVSKKNLYVRRTPSFFDNVTAPASGSCPLCFAVRNHQSLDMLLYARHDLSRSRRAVLMVRVSEHQLSAAADYFCTAEQHGVHNVLFVADTEHVAAALQKWGIPAFHDADRPALSALLAFLEVIKQAISKAYHVFVGSLDFVPVRRLATLTDSATAKPDIIVMQDEAARADFFFICSRGRTNAMWVEIMSSTEKALDGVGAMAPGSWRENVVFQKVWEQAVQSIIHAAAGSYKPSLGYFLAKDVVKSSAVFGAMVKDGLQIAHAVTGKKALDVATDASRTRTQQLQPISIEQTKAQLQGTHSKPRAFHDTIGSAREPKWDKGNLFWGAVRQRKHRCFGLSSETRHKIGDADKNKAPAVSRVLVHAVLVRMDV